jgi:hypothetical protein
MTPREPLYYRAPRRLWDFWIVVVLCARIARLAWLIGMHKRARKGERT